MHSVLGTFRRHREILCENDDGKLEILKDIENLPKLSLVALASLHALEQGRAMKCALTDDIVTHVSKDGCIGGADTAVGCCHVRKAFMVDDCNLLGLQIFLDGFQVHVLESLLP
jgi:hypothetical protein